MANKKVSALIGTFPFDRDSAISQKQACFNADITCNTLQEVMDEAKGDADE